MLEEEEMSSINALARCFSPYHIRLVDVLLGAPNENIVQNLLNIALLNVF